MVNIRAILVGDEFSSLQLLETNILAVNLNVDILDRCLTPLNAISSIIKNSPDLVFINIDMSEMSGFELYDNLMDLKVPHFEVIFISDQNNTNEVIQALKRGATDFLLKPIDEEALADALKRASKCVTSNHIFDRIPKPENLALSNKFLIHAAGSKILIDINKIIFVEAQGSYSHITVQNESKVEHYVIAQPLSTVEDKLQNDFFYRIHRSFIVNLNYITKVDRSTVYFAVGGFSIPISKRRATDFWKLIATK